MPIAPAIDPAVIYQGAAHIIIDKPAEKTNWKYIWTEGEVTVELTRQELDVQVGGFGQVVAPSTDETVTVTFTPSNHVDAAILTWLYGDLFAAKPGSSWFFPPGASANKLWIHTLDGRILEIANCRPTAFPGINFGVGVKRWNGAITCTGLVAKNTARSAANALFTAWAVEEFTKSPDEDEYPQLPCQVTWAKIPGTTLEAMDAWTVTPTAALRPITTANLGTIDYRVDNVSVEVSATPANLTEANLWSEAAIGASRQLGTSVAGGQMVLAEDVGGITCTLPNAVWVKHPTRYDPQNTLAGQCLWRSRRTFDGTGWGSVATLAMTI